MIVRIMKKPGSAGDGRQVPLSTHASPAPGGESLPPEGGSFLAAGRGRLRCQNGLASLDLALTDEACALTRGQGSRDALACGSHAKASAPAASISAIVSSAASKVSTPCRPAQVLITPVIHYISATPRNMVLLASAMIRPVNCGG